MAKSSRFRFAWKISKKILTRKERARVLVILGLTLINTALELVALALLVPFSATLITAESANSNLLNWLPTASLSPNVQLLILLALIVLIYLLKNAFFIWLTYLQQRLGVSITVRLTHHLLAVHLEKPYSQHLQLSSSLMLRNIQENLPGLLTYVYVPLLAVTTDSAVALAMLIFLAFLEPFGTLAVILVFVCGSISLLQLTRTITQRWGALRNEEQRLASRALLHLLGGVKEIKLWRRENVFLDDHSQHNSASQRFNYLFATIQQSPRAVFEILSFVSMGLLISLLIWTERPVGEIIPLLAVYTGAAFRILPSMQRIISSLQQLSFGQSLLAPILDDLQQDAALISRNLEQFEDEFESLELENVEFQFEGATSSVLNNITMSVCRGEFVGIIGPSGAGKSTLINVMLGLLPPTSGRVLVRTQSPAGILKDWKHLIGYVPQDIFLLDDSIRRNVAFSVAEHHIDDDAVIAALRDAQLWDFVQTLPAGLDTSTGERGIRLSGGQRQRLGIARALYHQPDILVFDEATAALDMQTEEEVLEGLDLQQNGRTVILVTHRMSTLRGCNRIYKLDDGTVSEFHG